MNSDIFGKWDETFRIACNAVTDTLVVEVRNRTAAALGSLGSVVSGGKSGDVIIGRCQLPLSSLLAGAPVNGWFALDSGGGVKLGLKLVYATPGSVPASYAITPLPVLAAAPGEFERRLDKLAVERCSGHRCDGCARLCSSLWAVTHLCPSRLSRPECVQARAWQARRASRASLPHLAPTPSSR
jgi:hypothetical protein